MAKKLLLILTGVCFAPLFSLAQVWEVGAMLGASTYSGELTPGLIDTKQIHFDGGVLVRYCVNRYFTIKGNVFDGTISGDDQDATSPKNRQRNLNFRSNILDVGINGEINLTGFESNTRYFKTQYKTSPYIFAGLSVFHFDPEGYDHVTNQWVRLQPLGTEGQGTPRYNNRTKYDLTEISIPFGLGIKHNLSEHWNLGFEFGWRKTFTDYLDDVSNTYIPNDYLSHFSGALAARMAIGNSPANAAYGDNMLRGNPQTNDWYMIGGVTITYIILPPYCPHF